MLKRLSNKKGFSLIELIVVIAILGILVMLAMPKFLGYVEKAELARIRHDVKVMQNKMDEGMIYTHKEYHGWEDNTSDLRLSIMAKELYETAGLAKNLARSKSPMYQDFAGPTTFSSENLSSTYKVIPIQMKKDIRSSLPGTFYSNRDGKVYYAHHRPLSSIKEEIPLGCEAPKPGDYEFEHLTGTIVKYHGNLQHIVIPPAFEVDGVCWPVLIIGKGAFSNMKIKDVVIPNTVKDIENDAFKDNDLEEVEIPPSVGNIGGGAFGGNHIGNPSGDEGGKGAIIKNKPGDVEIGPGAFDNNGPKKDTPAIPQFRPSTPGDLDIEVDIKEGEDGKPGAVIKGYDGPGGGVVIPPTIIIGGKGYPVIEIEEGAYQGKGIITVQFPEGLLRIEDYAFAGNQIIAVNTPHSLQHIGNYAFGYNEVTYKDKYKATIRTITIPTKEQVNNLDKKGDIVSGGVKVAKLKDAVLLDHIFIDSNNDVKIVTGNGDKTENGNTNEEKEAIKEIQTDLDIIGKDIDNLGGEPSDIQIKSIEDNLNVTRVKINNLTDGTDKYNIQKSFNNKSNQLKEIKKIKEVTDLLNELEGKISHNNIGGTNVFITNIQNKINDLIDKTMFQQRLNKLKNIVIVKNDLAHIQDKVNILGSKPSDSEIAEVNKLINATQSKIDLLEDSTNFQSQLDNLRSVLDNIGSDSEEGKGMYTKEEIDRLVNSEGYIRISKPEDFDIVRSDLSRKYIQVNNIDLVDIIDFEPIGTDKEGFKGIYDGGNFTIKNLHINSSNNLALFHKNDGGELKNIGLIDVNLKGVGTIAALVTTNTGTINNSYSTGSIEGDGQLGGLVARNTGAVATISNSYSEVKIVGRGSNIGGLVAINTNGAMVESSYATGPVEGSYRVGGLVGYNSERRTKINNSYATGRVLGKEKPNWRLNKEIGGLVGMNYYYAEISNSYSTGKATGGSNVGGLVGGSDRGSSTLSYYDSETSGQLRSSGGTRKTTVEMKNESTYSAWNSDTIWKIIDGEYPVLQWQD